MKKFRLVFMFVLASTLLIFSCDKEKPVPTLPYEQVFGSWDWYSTTTGWGVTTYADSVAYKQSLEVTRQGNYVWKQNDSIIADEDYTIKIDTLEKKEIFIFQFDDSSRVDQSFYIHKDTLHLMNLCADCDAYIFVRH